MTGSEKGNGSYFLLIELYHKTSKTTGKSPTRGLIGHFSSIFHLMTYMNMILEFNCVKINSTSAPHTLGHRSFRSTQSRHTHTQTHTLTRRSRPITLMLSPKMTRSSAIAEGPRDASCQLKSCQLPRNSAETTYRPTTSPDRIDGMKLEI